MLRSLRSLPAERKANLRTALERLSLAWADGLEWLCLTDEIPVACWGLNLETEEETLALNPEIFGWPPRVLELVLQHELLHRASYAVAWRLPDTDAANLALDITINYILHTSDRSSFEEFRAAVYARSSGAILLAAGPNASVSAKWMGMHREIWQRTSPPSPVPLYYTLAERLPQAGSRQMLNPFGGLRSPSLAPRSPRPRGKAGRKAVLPGDRVSPLQRAARKVARQTARDVACRGWGRTDLPFSAEYVAPADGVDVAGVRALLSTIRTQQVARKTASVLLSREMREPVSEWLCRRPTRTTQVFMAAGLVPDLLPLYVNETPRANRPCVQIYVDASGSLLDDRDLVVAVVKAIGEWLPATTHVFADRVIDVSTADLASGQFRQGGGTNFERVLQHFTGSQAEAALVLTDGWGSLNLNTWRARLREKGQRLYVVFVNVDPGPPLTGLAVDWTTVERERRRVH
jgi:hypothetical protein